MSNTRSRIAALLAVAAVALTACGGDDEPSASGSGTEAPSGEPSDEPSTPTETALEFACPPQFRSMLPEGLDPESCWAHQDLERAVLADGTVFALEPDALDPEAPHHVVALDAETGDRLWASAPLPGAATRLRATEVDGAPGVAVVVTENDAGDALTEASTAWGYLAWPADADGDAVEAEVHLTAPQDQFAPLEVYWTDQGLLAGNQFLAPDADAFALVNRDPEPMLVGDYDLDERFAGVSGDLLMSYVKGVAWTPDGSENGETYVGWLARTADGAEAWNAVTSTPNVEDSLFGEGPNQLTIVIGGYLLTITPTDENYTAFELSWLDAATHAAATPAPADLAGAEPIAADADVMAGETGTLLSPDGTHLFASWSTLALIVDVEAGTVTRVPTDFDIAGSAIDDTTVYGATENGTLTLDLASGQATPVEEPRESFDLLDGEFGALLLDDVQSGTTYLVGGRRTEAG